MQQLVLGHSGLTPAENHLRFIQLALRQRYHGGDWYASGLVGPKIK